MNKARVWRQSSVEVFRSAAGLSYVVNGQLVGGAPLYGAYHCDINSAYPAAMLRDAAAPSRAPSAADEALRLYRKLRVSSTYGLHANSRYGK